MNKTENWSAFDEMKTTEPEPWKKERWYSGDVNGCMGGAYFSRLGKKPTNPPQERNMRIMKMGKQMELLLVNEILDYYQKPVEKHFVKQVGYIFNRLKLYCWNQEVFEKAREINDSDAPVLDKFHQYLEYIEYLFRKVFFEGYRFPWIDRIETQHYIRDDVLEIGMRLDLLIICIPNTRPSLIYEIKSINSKAFWWMSKSPKGFQPKEDHVKQAHLYLDYKRKVIPDIQARVLYISRDDMTIKECNILYDEKDALSQVEKFKYLGECWRKKIIPEVEPAIVFEDGKYGVNWKAQYCSHHGLCMKDLLWEKKAEIEVARLNHKLKYGKVEEPKEEKKPKRKYAKRS